MKKRQGSGNWNSGIAKVFLSSTALLLFTILHLPATSLAAPSKQGQTAPIEAPLAPVPAPPAGTIKSAVQAADAPPAVAAQAPAAPASASAAVKPRAAVPVNPLAAEWDFLQGADAQTSPAILAAAAQDLESFADQRPNDARAAAALFLAGQASAKAGEKGAAMVDFLRVVYEHPESDKAFQAKSSFLELAYAKLSGRDKPALDALVNAQVSGDRTSREAALIDGISGPLAKAWAAEAADYVYEFKERFPDYPQGDRIQGDLARLFENSSQSEAALWEYRKLLESYPQSALLPRALLSVADLYAGPLRDYQKAVDAYQDFVSRFPDDPDVLNALRKTANLLRDKLAQYPLAIQIDQKIAALFPHTLSAMTALKDAADLADDRLGDYKLEVQLRTQIATEFSVSSEAAYQLYYAGLACEKHLMDRAQALTLYEQALDHSPGFWLRFRIKRRVKGINKAQAASQPSSGTPSSSSSAPAAAPAPSAAPLAPLTPEH